MPRSICATSATGNPGFWNARETLGRRAAIPVFVGDSAKGVAAALVGAALADPGVWGLAYVGCGAAMVGHSFPVFARFRGGRSILTFAGGAAVFATVPFLITIGLLLVTFVVTRSFAVAARVGFVAFPIVQIAIEGPYRTAATGVLMTFIGVAFRDGGGGRPRRVPLRRSCDRARSGDHAWRCHGRSPPQQRGRPAG